ncbi:hypothetical protein [Rhodopseudomonas sp. BR0G17]|uniref:hypothetical protein n=1 Tax=Rhodopseudomonas sp. BR0G17 TaxID=2269368 RepID=UPI0013DEE664|nr:hypothetical protein [Rhodopseudomonas sp. BR0G17]
MQRWGDTRTFVVMTDNVFVSALDAEIADLEADIAANPDVRVVKLSNLKALRQNFYSSTASSHHISSGTLSVSDQFRTQTVRTHLRTTGRRRAPETKAALNAARELISGRTYPTRTSEIFSYLTQRGISVPGTDPASNLSAMLSKSDEFVSHGRSGWTLASADDGPPDPNHSQPQRADTPVQFHYDISPPSPPPTPAPTAPQPGSPWAHQRKDDIFE